MTTIRIGSRDSRLAVIQSEMLIDYLEQNRPEVQTKLITMKTTGDIILDRPLEQIGGKGLFVKELDRALLDGRTDVSVHSLKDMPMEIPQELPLIGFSHRADPRDVLVLPAGVTEWDMSKPVGCSGKRRVVQLHRMFPGITTAPIRGNVQTRLRKLDEGQYGAIILAAAGLKRMGLECRISRYFEVEELIPAAGQAILAVQGRQGQNYSCMSGFFDKDATVCALAERAFVRKLDGGCSSPIAAFATVRGEILHLRGLYCGENSMDFITGEIEGSVSQPEQLGEALAQNLLEEMHGR